MKLAIDSYSYHRYFGHIYDALELDPGVRWTMNDFIAHANELGVSGVSIESCFLPDLSQKEVKQIRELLSQFELECVWAWGHPSGLHSGKKPEELQDLKRNVDIAAQIGATVMRICCGGRRTRPTEWAEHKRVLLPLLLDAVAYAKDRGVVLAIENHIDFSADELVELVELINSPWLGVCLDTANNLRLLEDPQIAIEKLAPYAKATHIKDVCAYKGNPNEFSFWPSVPVGQGVINIERTFDVLSDHGYKGLLALEIDYLHPKYSDELTAVRDSIDYMKGLL